MFQEVGEKEALQAYQEGKDVLILQDAKKPYPMVCSMGQLFEGKRFVIDINEPEPVPEIEPETVPDLEPSKKKGLDVGKIIALHNAGWSYAKIADEMGTSQSTIYHHVKKYYENPKKQEE